MSKSLEIRKWMEIDKKVRCLSKYISFSDYRYNLKFLKEMGHITDYDVEEIECETEATVRLYFGEDWRELKIVRYGPSERGPQGVYLF